MALQDDLGDFNVRAVSLGGECGGGGAALFNNFFSVTFKEDFPDELELVLGGRAERFVGVGEVPGGVESFRQRQVLLGYRPTTDPGAQERGHEAVALFGADEVADFEHAHGQAWDDGEVLAEGLFEDGAPGVVLVEGLHFGDFAEALEGGVVEFVDVADVLVGQGGVGERLHVAEAVGDACGQF